MHHWTTFVFVLVVVTVVCKILLWLRPYVPAFAILEHKEVLLLMLAFVVVALFVAYAMYPAIRPFDSAKVGPMPEYRGPGSPECF
jgi:hypothetical protein